MGGTMPFEARALVPLGDHPPAVHPAFDDAAEPELTLFDVAEDSLPTEGLAAALVRRSRRPVWLRLARRIATPARFSFRWRPRRRVSARPT